MKQNAPPWLDHGSIDEIKFCQEFLQEHPMICVNDAFFTVEGRIHDESGLRHQIFEKLKPNVAHGLPKKVSNLLDVLKMECHSTPLPIHHDRIHVANGTYFLDGTFLYQRTFCRNRLPVAYHPDAPQPVTWLHFLSQLLEPEDILTLQEFMGYCFLPTTKGQKMLFLVGKGGEGKSRIGVVLNALLGSNMNTGSIAKVEASPFARADLEHRLVLLDDDMKLEALPQTNNIKAIVTAELPMDLEKKGKQSYQGDLYVRFLAFGNGTLSALYDRSIGFFRRQIILTTKDRDPNRIDDPYLSEKLIAEKEGIFLWCLEGLHRLIDNNFQFTVSEQAKANIKDAIQEGNSIVEFLDSEGYIQFKADSESTSSGLYAAYKFWCNENAATPLSMKSFVMFLKQNERAYNLEYTNKVHAQNGRYVRGFVGIEILCPQLGGWGVMT